MHTSRGGSWRSLRARWAGAKQRSGLADPVAADSRGAIDLGGGSALYVRRFRRRPTSCQAPGSAGALAALRAALLRAALRCRVWVALFVVLLRFLPFARRSIPAATVFRLSIVVTRSLGRLPAPVLREASVTACASFFLSPAARSA